MATPQHLKEFARKMRPLKEEPDLLETLEVFFQQGCIPSAAAKSLSIHRNNLACRLDKITALTGLDPTHFEHTVQLRLAMLLTTIPYGY